MELRNGVDFLVRRKLLIAAVTVVIALMAGVVSLLRAPVYQATARVLLHPDDPAEQLNDPTVRTQLLDPDRYVSSQIDIVKSEGVASAATQALRTAPPDSERARVERAVDPKEILSRTKVSQDGASDVLRISIRDADPAVAADVANAVAHAYQENRRLHAVAGLQRAADEVAGRLSDLQGKISALDSRIAAIDSRGEGDKAALVSARTAASAQYQSLYGKQQELLVNMSLKRGEAELVAPAKAPAAPANRKALRGTLLGGLVGLLLGTGAALLADQLDDRLRSRDDVERRNDIPVLAELPFEADETDSGVATVVRPLGSLSEAVRSLRSVLLFLNGNEPPTRLLVTSPGPAEGKSLVAANLAASYAQAGFRTVLVSADLRRPRAEALFGLDRELEGVTELVTRLSGPRWTPFRPGPTGDERPSDGLHNGNGNGDGHHNGDGVDGPQSAAAPEPSLLRAGFRAIFAPTPTRPAAPIDVAALPAEASGDTELQEAVRAALVSTEVPDLWVLPAGSRPDNPAELLGSRRAADMLDELDALVDVVIMDSPPVLPVTDATVLAPRAEGVILVNSLQETHASAAQRAREILAAAHAPLLGVVVNKVRRSSVYGYYGGYYGSYGDQGRNEHHNRWPRLSLPHVEVRRG